jgi:type I restriction-modification system DNA methylase subunit
MAAPQIIHELIERFDRNIEAYESGKYNETQVRREFIDPFFEALGWDVNNKDGNAETYKDVIHEDAVKVSGVTKAPDYAFRIGGQRKFFVEAKKPSVNLKDEPAAAFQIRRYAWSAKLPLSIITDFEEFAVYDCRIKPDQKDKADKARIIYYTYRQYADKWDEIAAIFSKDAILKGSFDKFAESSRAKRGTSEVDNAFLTEIESWRDALARNIALRNTLSVRELNDAVQRTIDRVIFLRIAEDRGIEDYGVLRSLCNGNNTYERLQELFYKADDRYNSGLFHFRHEKDQAEPPDNLTTRLVIDDKTLKDILKRLYYPDSPYEFSVLPADILGQVYEQFLGKVIRLTSDHRAVVEDKPEVKKAGGVFYTPTYIVDYIVKNTVGKLLEGKNPKTAEKLRILDPACGSGSFLLGAYQCLLDWHLKWYTENNPEKHAKAKKPILYQGQGGVWHLTTAERKRILLNNIYGVDIDIQAVEVTKLSLLLKVLEDETGETLNQQRKLFHERALPNLGGNIKCGNSLIGPDFYEGKQLTMLDTEEAQRVNVFDWQAEFPEIFKAGGFDSVIGNPPYGASFGKMESEYFQSRYNVFSGVKDVYTCFIEKSFSILNNKGMHSFIVPSAWLGGPEYKRMRDLFLPHSILNIILLPFDIFKDAYIDTAVFVAANLDLNKEHCVRTYIYPKREKLTKINLTDNQYKLIRQIQWAEAGDKKFILDPGTVELLDKIRTKITDTFADMVEIKRGVLFDKDLLTPNKAEKDSYLYFEGDVYRYQLNIVANQWIEFSDKMKERPKEFKWFEGKRLLLRRLVNRKQRMMATFATDTFITNKNLYSILPKSTSTNILGILGLLNSRLISYLYINQVTQATKDDFPQVTIKDVLSLPSPILSKENASYDRMVQLVEQMLSLHKQLADAKTGHEQTLLQRQIDATDKQIDKLVYELYELTPDEITIIERDK